MNIGFSNPFRAAQPVVRPLAADAAVKMAGDGDIVVLDVRDHNEVARTGKAKGALHIPLFLLQQKADPRHPEFHPGLKTDKPIGIYCASGARSEMAGRAMAALGFDEVYNIGGLMHWQSAGGACEA